MSRLHHSRCLITRFPSSRGWNSWDNAAQGNAAQQGTNGTTRRLSGPIQWSVADSRSVAAVAEGCRVMLRHHSVKRRCSHPSRPNEWTYHVWPSWPLPAHPCAGLTVHNRWIAMCMPCGAAVHCVSARRVPDATGELCASPRRCCASCVGRARGRCCSRCVLPPCAVPEQRERPEWDEHDRLACRFDQAELRHPAREFAGCHI